MEARAAAISRFGASFHETLVVSTERAAKVAGKISGLLTPFLDMPAVKTLGEKVTGIASRRSLPPFAKKSLFEQIPYDFRKRLTESSLFCRLLRRLPAAVDRRCRHFGNVLDGNDRADPEAALLRTSHAGKGHDPAGPEKNRGEFFKLGHD